MRDLACNVGGAGYSGCVRWIGEFEMAIADLDYRFKPRRSLDAYKQAEPKKRPDLQLHVPIEGRLTHSDDKTPAPKTV